MKRKKLFSVIITIALAATFCFPACGKTSDKGKKQTTFITKKSLCGFESNKELLSVRWDYRIDGTVELQKENVTAGEYSAKLTTEMDTTTVKGNELGITFIPGTEFIPKTDYTDTVAIELDVFNAFSQRIQYQFVLNNTYVLKQDFLECGSNRLVVPTNRECYDFANVMTFDLRLDGKPAGVSDPYVLYLDNLVAVTVPDSVNKVNKSYAGDTPYKFESENDVKNVMAQMGTPESRFTVPKYTLNRNPKYTLYHKGSLKVEFFSNSANTGVDTLGFRTIDGPDSLSMDKYDFATTYLTFDMFNPTDKNITVIFRVQTLDRKTVGTEILIPAGSWSDPSQAKILLQDIKDLTIGTNINIATIIFLISGFAETGDCVYLDNISFKSGSLLGE